MRLRAGLRVLRRTATEVQVGTDPRWAVRLPDLTPAEADLLQSVDARTDLTDVARLAAGRDVDADGSARSSTSWPRRASPPSGAHRAVLRGPAAVDADTWSLLRADGDGAGVVRARADAVVAVLGLGPTGLGIAVGLAAAGVGTLLVDDERPVRSTDVGVCGYRWADAGSVREHVAARLLRDVAPHVVDRVGPDTGRRGPRRGRCRGPRARPGPRRGRHRPPRRRRPRGRHGRGSVRRARRRPVPALPRPAPHRRGRGVAHRRRAAARRRGRRRGRVPSRPSARASAPRPCSRTWTASRGLAPGATFEVALPDAVPRRRTWAVHPECGCTALPASLVGAPGR